MKFSFRFPASLASEATRAIRRRSIMLAVVGITLLPLAWRGASCGQDFDFHLQNWLEVAHAWRHGILNPHWAVSPSYQAGEPRFVFYPPLSRFLGAALGCLLPWSWTPLAFALVTLLGAAFSMRAMARQWAGPDNAAFAACLYVLNPYMVFVLYERAALAELLAAVWLPLLVLYGLRAKPPGRQRLPDALCLALVLAALWLTNAPAAVMGCYFLAVAVLIAAVRQRSLQLVWRALCAVPLGLALAGFWLVPAVYEQRWVQIDQAIGPLMRVEDSFLFGYVHLLPGASPDDIFNVHYHNRVLQSASWIVVVLLAAAAVAAGLSRRRKSPLWWPLAVAGILIAALQFRFSTLAWNLIPKLAFLQFPWRWMLVLSLILAALAALALSPEIPTRRVIAARALILLVLAAAMAAWSAFRFWQPCDDEDNIAAQIATSRLDGFEGTDEYTLAGIDSDTAESDSDQGPVTQPIVVMRGNDPAAALPTHPATAKLIPAQVRVLRWQSEHRTAQIDSPEAGFAVLRLMDYPAWRVTRNGAALNSVTHNADGWMVIPIEPGSTRIDVRWGYPRDERAGNWLSLAALAIALAMAAWYARRDPHPVEPQP